MNYNFFFSYKLFSVKSKIIQVYVSTRPVWSVLAQARHIIKARYREFPFFLSECIISAD